MPSKETIEKKLKKYGYRYSNYLDIKEWFRNRDCRFGYGGYGRFRGRFWVAHLKKRQTSWYLL